MIPVREFHSAAELRAHYLCLRHKLHPAKRQFLKVTPKLMVEAPPPPVVEVPTPTEAEKIAHAIAAIRTASYCSCRIIQIAVAQAFGFPLERLVSKKRQPQDISRARCIAMALALRFTSFKPTKISICFNRNRSTIYDVAAEALPAVDAVLATMETTP